MSRQLVLTVGNDLMGDDAAGPLLAEMLSRAPAEGWDVLNGGSAPENEVQRIRALGPDRVLIVDATDMDLEPGEVRLVDGDIIADQLFMTTHALPLTFLIDLLREFVPDVQLLGIQPSLVAFSYPLSPQVRRAVETLHENLRKSRDLDAYERL
jgi:hydrogenase 3 maturation protease